MEPKWCERAERQDQLSRVHASAASVFVDSNICQHCARRATQLTRMSPAIDRHWEVPLPSAPPRVVKMSFGPDLPETRVSGNSLRRLVKQTRAVPRCEVIYVPRQKIRGSTARNCAQLWLRARGCKSFARSRYGSRIALPHANAGAAASRSDIRGASHPLVYPRGLFFSVPCSPATPGCRRSILGLFRRIEGQGGTAVNCK